mgnify:CR=1 FL=1
MKTAVAILNWNGFSLLNKFLPSVIKNTPNNVDIYIIDNGSTDNSVNFIKTNFCLIFLYKCLANLQTLDNQ